MIDDIRLKEETMELDGKIFKLRCNFNVLADAQSYYGDFRHLNNGKLTYDIARHYLAYMLNDYADEMGWPERYSPRQAGRLLETEFTDMMAQVEAISALIRNAVMRESESSGVNP